MLFLLNITDAGGIAVPPTAPHVRREYYYRGGYGYSPEIKKKKKKPKYDEQELIRLIRRAVAEESLEAARLLRAEATNLAGVETAFFRFHSAFFKAKQKIDREQAAMRSEEMSLLAFIRGQEKKAEIRAEMEDEEEFIMKLLMAEV